MDDLTAPLGLAPTKKPKSWTGRRALAAIGSVGCVAILIAAWALLVRDPHGAAPVAVVPVAQSSGPREQTASIRKGVDAYASSTPATSPAAEEPGLVEITPAGKLTDLGNGVTISDPNAAEAIQLAAAPDEALIEDGPYGPIPRIGDDGRRPLEAYARPAEAAPASGAPRVAIVVGGIGIAETSTAAAIRDLPGPVTLAFAPYGKNLAAAVADARQAGHEILLQIPLEPYGYPRNDPGPRTLTVAAKAGENIDRLLWLMSRITTYVGVTNYLGARFTSEAGKLEPVLDEIGRRGLLYLDDGSSGASKADTLAKGVVPFGRADVVLDADTDPAAINERLKQLEAIARERGYAIASATAFPETIDRIAAYAKDAADHGIALVPITALIRSGRT